MRSVVLFQCKYVRGSLHVKQLLIKRSFGVTLTSQAFDNASPFRFSAYTVDANANHVSERCRDQGNDVNTYLYSCCSRMNHKFGTLTAKVKYFRPQEIQRCRVCTVIVGMFDLLPIEEYSVGEQSKRSGLYKEVYILGR